MPTFIDDKGDQQDVKLDVTLYREANAQGMTVPQLLNTKYPTKADAPVFEQMCMSSGLIMNHDREFGLNPPTLGAVLEGKTASFTAGTVLDANPASRILYPAVVLELIESQLAVDRETDPNAFDEMVALDSSVASKRMEQPVINLTPAEEGKSQAISQLAEPDQMLTITTSDQTKTIATTSLGLLVSEEALQATTIDFVSMAVKRQAEVERNAKVYEWLLSFLTGDLDSGQSALSQTKADTYDSTIVAAGAVSKKALVKWLINNYFTRRISHVVGTTDNLLAIEDALATTNTNQPIPWAMNPQFSLMNRMISDLRFFNVSDDSGWTANTLMGLDKRYAIHRIRNTAAEYAAMEEFVLRKAKQLRFDTAVVATRMFDDAFDVLSLTLT